VPTSSGAPNIVLVVFDTARADAFTPYGAAPDVTPVIDSVARDGQAVEQAFSVANWTLPSHMSMLTGLMPRRLGLGHRLSHAPEGPMSVSTQALRTVGRRYLPVALQAAGYQTMAASASVWVGELSGFDLGISRFVTVRSQRNHLVAGAGLRRSFAYLSDAIRAEVDDGLTAVEGAVRGMLADADPRRPFFLFVNVFECHSPFLPPRPYNDLGPWSRALAGWDARRHLTLEGVFKACVTGRGPSPRSLARMRHLYLRSVRSMDDWLGRLLDTLTEGGRLDDTLLVVTSDHGENFGEGGLIGHAVSLDDRLTHVPLVLRGAPEVPASPFSLASLPGFLAAAAGLDDAVWREEAVPEGVAVAQLDGFADADDPRIGVAADAWGLSEAAVVRLTRSLTAARDDRVKLVRHPGGEDVYDLESDPQELAPLDAAGVLPAELSQRLPRLRAALDHPAVATLTDVIEDPGSVGGNREDLHASMRMLGYM